MNGNCEDLCDFPEEMAPDSSGRKYGRLLIDSIVQAVCNCVEESDADIHLQVIKTLVTIVSTFSCPAHDQTLLDAL